MENEEMKTVEEVTEEAAATTDSGTKAFILVIAASMAVGAIAYNCVAKPLAKKIKERISARKAKKALDLDESDIENDLEEEEPEE